MPHLPSAAHGSLALPGLCSVEASGSRARRAPRAVGTMDPLAPAAAGSAED